MPSEPAFRFLIVCLGGSILLLSAVSGKQVYYLMPVMPVAALVITRCIVLDGALRGNPDLRLISAGTVLAGVLPLCFNAIPELSGGQLAQICPAWVSLPLMLCGVVLICFRADSLQRFVRGLATAAVAFIAILVAGMSTSLWQSFDITGLAQHVARLQSEAVSVAWWGEYQGQLHFAGRLVRPITELREPEQFSDWISQHPEGRLVLRLVPPQTIAVSPGPISAVQQQQLEETLRSESSARWRSQIPVIDYAVGFRHGLNRSVMVVLRFCGNSGNP